MEGCTNLAEYVNAKSTGGCKLVKRGLKIFPSLTRRESQGGQDMYKVTEEWEAKSLDMLKEEKQLAERGGGFESIDPFEKGRRCQRELGK